MHFVGNIEGREVFQGIVDVLVTDGFTGNVLLKTSEGASSYILSYLEQALKKASNLDFKSIFNHLHQHFDYEEYPGAIICGIDAVVVKCHGHSSSIGMFNAIKGSVSLVQNHFISQIKSQLELFNIS